MATGQKRDFKFKRNFQNQNNRMMNTNSNRQFKTLTNKRTGAKIMVQSKSIRDQKIAENLRQLKENAAKKRRAQESYYNGMYKGQSPLIRTQSGMFQQESNARGPVKHRLGNNNPQFNRLQQGRINPKKNFNGKIKAVNRSGKVVYLQPLRQRMQPNPAKLTVCVENDQIQSKHHATVLDPVLQREIKLIQQKPRQIVADVYMPNGSPVASTFVPAKLPIVTTGTTLNERFSMI